MTSERLAQPSPPAPATISVLMLAMRELQRAGRIRWPISSPVRRCQLMYTKRQPRRGSAKAVVAGLSAASAPTMLYTSCHLAASRICLQCPSLSRFTETCGLFTLAARCCGATSAACGCCRSCVALHARARVLDCTSASMLSNKGMHEAQGLLSTYCGGMQFPMQCSPLTILGCEIGQAGNSGEAGRRCTPLGTSRGLMAQARGVRGKPMGRVFQECSPL